MLQNVFEFARIHDPLRRLPTVTWWRMAQKEGRNEKWNIPVKECKIFHWWWKNPFLSLAFNSMILQFALRLLEKQKDWQAFLFIQNSHSNPISDALNTLHPFLYKFPREKITTETIFFLTEVIYDAENKSTQFQHYLRLIIDAHSIETLPSPRVLEKVVCSRCCATSDVLGHLLACVAWRFLLGAQSK